MKDSDKKRIMDSLTNEQREGIASIIEDADIADAYQYSDDAGSVCVEDASGTLRNLACYFRSYDPESATD